MSFSNEEHIEEILWNAHAKGIVNPLTKEVSKRLKENPYQSRLDVYIQVYNKLTQDINLSKK